MGAGLFSFEENIFLINGYDRE